MTSPIRILVVEDYTDLRETYVGLLEDEGYAVSAAGDLSSALDLLGRVTFHVALVDIMLGGMGNRDGVTVIQTIKELGEGTSAVALTAQKDVALVRDLLKSHGAYDYASKDRLSAEGADYLLATVSGAAGHSTVLPNDGYNWTWVARGFASQITEQQLVTSLLTDLSFGGGFEAVRNALTWAADRLFLVAPYRSSEGSLRLDSDRQTFTGLYWSKALGAGVQLCLFGRDSARDGSDTGALFHRERAGLHVDVVGKPALTREAFGEPICQ